MKMRYLVHFAGTYHGFRRAEFESIGEDISVYVPEGSDIANGVFWTFEEENEKGMKRVLERLILGKQMYEIWGEGKLIKELHLDVKDFLDKNGKYFKYGEKSFRIDFCGHGGGRNSEEKIFIIESFSYLGFRGGVSLMKPEDIFAVIEEYSIHDFSKTKEPTRCWFGRLVAESLRSKNVIDKFNLKKRNYIGTTSFEAEMSLVACNIAKASPYKFFYDPFVGTGSFLVAAAFFGATVFGSDINLKVLKGKDGFNMASNFKQYSLDRFFIDNLLMDITNDALSDSFKVDCIICDPPYGYREGLKVCGLNDSLVSKKKLEKIVEFGSYLRKDFIHPKKSFEICDMISWLFEFSERLLLNKGRLVFWIPTTPELITLTSNIKNKFLTLKYNLNQDFGKWSRRLMVYEKTV